MATQKKEKIPLDNRKREIKAAMVAAFEANPDAEWMDRLVLSAGYVRPGALARMKDLVGSGAVASNRLLADWVNKGLPYEQVGSAKMYDVYRMLAWVTAYYKRGGGMQQQQSESLKKYNEIEAEYKAKERKRKYDEQMGNLISKDEALEMFNDFALQAIAGMETAFGGIAPQLENLPTTEIRKQLEQRIEWLCEKLAKGRVPIPKDAVSEVKQVIQKHRSRG